MIELHPALVHFPIALLIAAGGFYAWGWWQQREELSQSGWYLHLAGLAGAVLAIFSGLSAQGGLDLSEEVDSYLQNHTLLGYLVAWLFALLAIWRYLRGNKGSQGERVAFLAAFLLSLGVMAYSAWLGGHMVYAHGVGVQQP
jgi:uncharacterized membrane protein